MCEANIIYGQLLLIPTPKEYKYIAIDGKKYRYVVYAFTHEPCWEEDTKLWSVANGPSFLEEEDTDPFYCLGPYYDAFETTSTKPPVKPSKSLRKL